MKDFRVILNSGLEIKVHADDYKIRDGCLIFFGPLGPDTVAISAEKWVTVERLDLDGYRIKYMN